MGGVNATPLSRAVVGRTTTATAVRVDTHLGVGIMVWFLGGDSDRLDSTTKKIKVSNFLCVVRGCVGKIYWFELGSITDALGRSRF